MNSKYESEHNAVQGILLPIDLLPVLSSDSSDDFFKTGVSFFRVRLRILAKSNAFSGLCFGFRGLKLIPKKLKPNNMAKIEERVFSDYRLYV